MDGSRQKKPAQDIVHNVHIIGVQAHKFGREGLSFHALSSFSFFHFLVAVAVALVTSTL